MIQEDTPRDEKPLFGWGCWTLIGGYLAVCYGVPVIFLGMVYFNWRSENAKVPLSWQCQGNLLQLAAAKKRYAIQSGKTRGTPVGWDDLLAAGVISSSDSSLKCPMGGTYHLGAVGENPVCSIGAEKGGYPPHRVEYAQASECQMNLARLYLAKERYVSENRIMPVSCTDLVTSVGKPLLEPCPECSAGGTYTLGPPGEFPKCSVGENNRAFPGHVVTSSSISFVREK